MLSAQETAEKLNSSLPVNLTSSHVQQYPDFTKLLTSLTRHVTDSGMSLAVYKDMKQAEGSLRQQKLKFLQLLALYSELKELLIDYDLRKQDVHPSSSAAQLFEALKESFAQAEALDYLNFHPEGGEKTVTLLGLKAENLMGQHHKKSVYQSIIPELESRLRSKCETVASFHKPSKQIDDSQLLFAKATQLPALIENEKQSVEQEMKQLHHSRMLRDKQFRQLFEVLMQSLQTLERLIADHRLQSQAKHDRVTAEWLTAKCDAMCLKVRVLQNQMIRDTYTPDAMAALKRIKAYLKVAEEQSAAELHRLNQMLVAYESVGMGFDSLVQQYGALMAEIDNKKWALSELQQTQDDNLGDLWSQR
ncbi:HAUS augmin-like complex subunit 4 isoform X2 [Montipora capricornis]|uniref:HAUS augmin-like complex subunit 4 isoform X2 n=1 Tax=Montipora capricornis TaxID=246305 RepID=UPI0035F18E3D